MMQSRKYFQNQRPSISGKPFFKPLIQRQPAADEQIKTETLSLDTLLEEIPETISELEKIKQQIVSGKGDLCKLSIEFLKHGLNTSAKIDVYTPILLNSFSILVANCSSLAPYITLKTKAITDPGVFLVHDHYRGNDDIKNTGRFDSDPWHDAVSKGAGISKNKREEIRGVGGFYNRNNDTINMPEDGTVGSAMHETMHRMSTKWFKNATYFNDKAELNEGVTQYFTDLVLNEFGIPSMSGNNYGVFKAMAKKLANKTGGNDLLAKVYFQSDVPSFYAILFKLGLTSKPNQAIPNAGQKLWDLLK